MLTNPAPLVANTFTDAFSKSLARFFDYLPQLIGAIVLLIIGWLIARILQIGVRNLLRSFRFDHAIHTSPGGRFIIRIVESPTRLLARLAFWVVFLIFVTFALSALNIQILNTILFAVYAYIPHVIAAIVIFLVASAIAAGGDAFVNRLMGRTALARIIMTIIPTVTLSIAGFMILDELLIAPDIVNITYTALMGSLALGLALAFGLGGRDIAHDILQQAYDAGRRNSDRVASNVNRARSNARRAASDELNDA